jgi:hypothetical protein
MAAEKSNGKDIKKELLLLIKEQINNSPFPYLEFLVRDNNILFTPDFVNTLKITIPCSYASHISRKLCTLITGCDIIRFIKTGDNFRGIPTGFNVYGKIMNAMATAEGTIRIYFEWKGVYHE